MFKHTIILDDIMEKRTTVVLEKEVYDALVRESIEEYNNSKAISKVLNKIIKKALANKGRLSEVLHSEKVAKTTAKEFEKFRRELSKSV